jgi:hypothetical protein
MRRKTWTVEVLYKRYRDTLQEELHRDSTSSSNRHVSKSEFACLVNGEEIVSALVLLNAYDEALKLFEDSPLLDFFAYIFNKVRAACLCIFCNCHFCYFTLCSLRSNDMF